MAPLRRTAVQTFVILSLLVTLETYLWVTFVSVETVPLPQSPSSLLTAYHSDIHDFLGRLL